jgi:CheY-like chemotaxis protein
MKKINTIFLIDDDEMFNFINENVIRMAGFKCDIKCFTSAEIALKKIEEFLAGSEPDENTISVIFLDINMPGMDGWEFLEEYKKLPESSIAKCKSFIVSSSIDPADIERSKTYSVVSDFISKPLTVKKLDALRETYSLAK